MATGTHYNHVIRALSDEEKRKNYDALLDEAQKKDPMFGVENFIQDNPWEEYRKELRMLVERRPMSPTTEERCRRNAEAFAQGILERHAKKSQ